MKIKHLLLGMLAMAAAVACKQDEPVEEPKLDVDKTTVALQATAGEATFTVTTNQNWVATADADWVSMDPASGAASEKAVTVKVTADDNTTTEARTATVTVKAGALTKTVAVTQAAGAGETPGPGDEPELPASEWALVGSFNGWDPASTTYLSVLDENYFVLYGFELEETTEFKFLKGGAWPPTGTEIGGNGLVEPNTIQPAGGSNIKVTEAGKYDIYLAADLTKFYIMSEGKTPAEATEPAPVETSWGMMGMFVDNQWSSDVPMAKEGEWIVAKGAQFSELTFKIRGNQSWADATNIGTAPGSERGVVNGKISVVTAEYSKANLGGDAADIKLNGEAGTYDVYFSVEKMEVYVMEQGFKPGEKEPQNPDPVEITYTVVGTIADNAWSNNAAVGLMAAEGNYLVAKNIPFVWNSTLYGGDYNRIEFKIVETGTWGGFAYPEKNVDQYANAEITVGVGGENIAVDAPVGNYDVYFDKANLKVWVMEAGYKPGEKDPLVPETPAPADVDIDGKQWQFTWNVMYGVSSIIDLGVTVPGYAILAIDYGIIEPSYSGVYVPYMAAEYTITKTDATSGVVTLTADGQSLEIPYSNATETSVHLVSTALLYEDVDCTVAANKIDIMFEEPGQPNEPDGSEANPYLVADAEDLQAVASVLVADATTYVKLAANIDLAGVEWTPIATTETVDEATVVKAIALDGCNYTISNAKDALFSTLCGSVQNLTIDGAAINATTTVGVIANEVNDATIKNVVVKNSSIVSTAGEAGGVVGKLTKGTLENVQSACSVSGTQQLGGLVGVIYDGTIKNCVATGEVTGANYYIGGLVGYVKAGTLQNCAASGNVTSASTAYSRVGGLVGQIDNATITGCHATGNVKGDGHYCGGLIGVCVKGKINVSQSYATGNIIMPSSVNKSGGAGLIGVIESGDVTVANCYATGDVTAHRWSAAFIGRVSAGTLSVTNCYSKSNCTFTQPANCGALTGELNAKATMTYSGVVVWNLSNLDLFIRPDVTTAPEGNYYGVEGTISAKAKEFNWDTAIWDLSKDDPTLK